MVTVKYINRISHMKYVNHQMRVRKNKSAVHIVSPGQYRAEVDREAEVAVLQVAMVHHLDLEAGLEVDWVVVYHVPSLNPSIRLQREYQP